jgi:hypothetical protein
MGNSIIQQVDSSLTPDQQSIGVLVELIEMEYPGEDTNDIPNLCRLLKKEFGMEFSENDVLNYYVVSLQEEDNRLQYKHLNISV